MARVTRASKPKSPAKDTASPAKTTVTAKADTPVKTIEDTDAAQTKRQKRKTLRSHEYKRQKRRRAVQALKTFAQDPEQPLSKAQRNQARAEIYRQWTPKAQKSEKLSELEQVVLRQQEEIQQLRQQVGGTSKSPDAAMDAAKAKVDVGGGRGGRRARKSTA